MRQSLKGGVLTLFLFLSLGVLSCSRETEGSSFLAQLDTVDAFIKTSQTEDALKYLKKAEKGAYSAYARLGIYRRYMTLGEEEKAEGVLQKALKSLPDNPELTAVYTQFLLRQNRGSEALSLARILEGGKYGSLYAEAVLRKHDIRGGAKNLEEFLDEKLASIYYGAFTGTNDAQWLRDSALIYLAQGDYAQAGSLQNDHLQDSKDALFWSLVQYDAGQWDLCLQNLSQATGEKEVPRAALLASDVYVRLNDEDSAERERSRLLVLREGRKEFELSPSVLVNSALWSRRHGNYRRSYDLILEAVTEHADFVPSLLSYAQMAWEDEQPVEMTALEKSVRSTELRTAAMAKIDQRPKILLEDAVYRLKQESIRQQKEEIAEDDRLETLLLMLSIKMDEKITRTKKLALLWEALEKNELGKNLYPPLLVQYCVHELGYQGHGEEARTLFENYLNARYQLEQTSGGEEQGVATDIFGGVILNTAQSIPEGVVRQAFTNRAAGDVHDLEIWEGETAAYFALLDENVDAARRLYEYVLFETGGGRMEGGRIESISTFAATSSAVNLAMVYSSTGEKEKALSLYRLAFGVADDSAEKSMILYRTAVIQEELNDIRGALLTLEYSLALNPMNVDAKLLKRQLEK